jgi:spore germination cell wall hydrolase CwlJ-like protein
MSRYKNDPQYKALKDTVYGEARGESLEGQKAVASVIKNRVEANKSYWGGDTYTGVCYHPNQFECHTKDMTIREKDAYDKLDEWLPGVYASGKGQAPYKGVDHFNNPAKEGKPAWTRNCDEKYSIGGHTFYQSKQ